MGRSGHVGGKPITQPPNLLLGMEWVVIEGDRGEAAGGAVFWGAPVDQFGFGYREGEPKPFRFPRKGLEPGLEDLDISPIGGGHGGKREVVHKREGILCVCALVKGGHI